MLTKCIERSIGKCSHQRTCCRLPVGRERPKEIPKGPSGILYFFAWSVGCDCALDVSEKPGSIDPANIAPGRQHNGRLRSAGMLVAVEDTGTGLDAAMADRIFTPFTTTKPHGIVPPG
jgi:hypothetical protein